MNEMHTAALGRMSLILVEPQNAGNLGSVLRLAQNFDMMRVDVVAPRFDLQSRRVRVLATRHGIEALGLVRECATLEQALEDVDLACAFAGQRAGIQGESCSYTFLAAHAQVRRVALVFGREDHGLKADEIALCHHVVTIPTAPVHASLNLSHAVAIAVSQIYQSIQTPADSALLSQDLRSKERPPRTSDLILMGQRLQSLMEKSGFAAGPHAARHVKRLRLGLARGAFSDRETQIILGFLKSLEETRL